MPKQYVLPLFSFYYFGTKFWNILQIIRLVNNTISTSVHPWKYYWQRMSDNCLIPLVHRKLILLTDRFIGRICRIQNAWRRCEMKTEFHQHLLWAQEVWGNLVPRWPIKIPPFYRVLFLISTLMINPCSPDGWLQWAKADVLGDESFSHIIHIGYDRCLLVFGDHFSHI